MLSQEALAVVLEESETMIIEWADTQDGFGVGVIEDKLNRFLTLVVKDGQGLTDDQKQKFKDNIKQFIKNDMFLFCW